MANRYLLLGAVAPRVTQIDEPGATCNTSFARAGFLTANRLGLDLRAAFGGIGAESIPLPRLSQQSEAIAIVEMTAEGVDWKIQTKPFMPSPGVEVAIDDSVSNLNGVALSGNALLEFSTEAFTLGADALLAGAPDLPRSGGELEMVVKYSLSIDGEQIPIRQYAAVMNVSIIGPVTGAPALAYTMGNRSIKFGSLFLPDFALPVGATRASGFVDLAGTDYSIHLPFVLTADPFGNILGTAMYPANMQGTNPLALNLSGSISTIGKSALAESVLNLFVTGDAVGDATRLLSVPNYLPTVEGVVVFERIE